MSPAAREQDRYGGHEERAPRVRATGGDHRGVNSAGQPSAFVWLLRQRLDDAD